MSGFFINGVGIQEDPGEDRHVRQLESADVKDGRPESADVEDRHIFQVESSMMKPRGPTVFRSVLNWITTILLSSQKLQKLDSRRVK